MIWLPALAALGAMQSRLQREQRLQQLKLQQHRNATTSVLPRGQVPLRCDVYESTCEWIQKFSDGPPWDGDDEWGCEVLVEFGERCLYGSDGGYVNYRECLDDGRRTLEVDISALLQNCQKSGRPQLLP
jgi:hypothetical protein